VVTKVIIPTRGSIIIATIIITSSIYSKGPTGLDNISILSTISTKSIVIIGRVVTVAVYGRGMLFLYLICQHKI
jgi:hypothetical protein